MPGLINSEIVMTISTFLIAVFTYLVWRLQKRTHDLSNYAVLKSAIGRTSYSRSSNTLRCELLLLNTSAVAATIQSWKVRIKDGDYTDDISGGSLGSTKLMIAQKYISAPGWVIVRDTPTALSIESRIGKATPLSSGAKIAIEIFYAGGRQDSTRLQEELAVETH